MRNLLLAAVVAAALVGWTSLQPAAPRLPVEFKIAQFDPSADLTQKTIRGSDRQVYLHDQALLTNAHIDSTEVRQSHFGPQIRIVFTDEGRDILARVTRENIDKPLAIVVDGEVITAPVIRSELSGGVASIAGGFTQEEAHRLAEGIMGR